MMGRRLANEFQSIVDSDSSFLPVDSVTPGVDDGLLRLLILDPGSKTLDQVQNALWMWPHKLATADSVMEGVAKCRRLDPVAVLMANDFPDQSNGDALVRLRALLPHVPIIAITSIPGAANTTETLKRGANAVILRGELERPTLHNLLMHLREKFRLADTEAPLRQPGIGMPWRDSRMLGCVLCDVNGTVIDANDCIAAMLGYSGRTDLLGACVWRDVLQSPVNWDAWKTVAGDLGALRSHVAAIRTAGGQALMVLAEVFAAPESPSHLQITFVPEVSVRVPCESPRVFGS
jgi:CheY-like chemotaxis protein